MTTNMEDMAPPELTNQSSLHLFGDLADSDSDNDNGEAAAVGKAVEEEPPLTPERMAGVVAQVEFYFSDANLPTDRKLLRIIKRDTPGWVPIKVFSQFRKIRAITKLMANIAISLRTSSRLEVSNDMKHVRRLAPIPNYDIGTLQKRYLCVENLPAGPTIEMVTAMFTEFGPISVVRIVARGESKGKLPSWMTNSVRMPMIGHAFVEFSDEDSATRAVQAVFDEARFAADRGQMITIVSAYSPTEAASDEEAGDFYLRVAALADKANDKRDRLIVAGGSQRRAWDSSQLRRPAVRREFNLQLSDRFGLLEAVPPEGADAQAEYDAMAAAIREVATNHLAPRGSRRRRGWQFTLSQRTLRLMNARQRAHTAWLRSKSAAAKRERNRANRAADAAVQRDRERWIGQHVAEAQDMLRKKNLRQFARACDRLAGRSRSHQILPAMRDVSGALYSGPDAVLKAMTESFDKLYGGETKLSDETLNQLENDVAAFELTRATEVDEAHGRPPDLAETEACDDPRSGLSIGRLTAPWLQSPMTTAGNTPRSTLRSRNGDPASARRDGNRDGSPTRSSPYSTPAARALHSSAHASPYTTPMQSKFSSRLAMATGSDGNGTWGRRTTSDSLAGIDESPKPGDKPPAERVPSPCERLATATPTQGGKYVAPGRRSVDPSPMKGDGSMYARNPNNPGGSPIKGVHKNDVFSLDHPGAPRSCIHSYSHSLLPPPPIPSYKMQGVHKNDVFSLDRPGTGVHKNDVFSLDHPGTPQRGSIGSRQPAGKPPLSITKPHAVPASAPASGGSHVQVSGTSPLQEKGAARVRVGMPKGDALSAMLAIDGSSAATAAAAAANAGGAPVTTPDGGGAETPVSDFISSIIASIPGVSSPTNFLHRGGQPGCKVTAVAAGDPSSRAAVATSGDDTQSSSGDVAAARTTPRAARSRRASQADDAIVGAVGATSGESGGEALPPGWGTVPQPGAAPMHGTPKKGGSCARQSAADGELEKHAKKDYASWAAATPMYRAESAAHGSGGGGTGSKVGAATPPYAAAAAGSRDASGCGPSTPGAPPPLGALEGGAQSQSVLISRGPDGSKGFGMGRGRALATPV
ncbi:hypothetical protein FOA52_015773 [Chlamydomonas sp. UWO 241]|nr:hypothetical protein FOA52_015773 [Chlamydomonas sp. UWO 241]